MLRLESCLLVSEMLTCLWSCQKRSETQKSDAVRLSLLSRLEPSCFTLRFTLRFPLLLHTPLRCTLWLWYSAALSAQRFLLHAWNESWNEDYNASHSASHCGFCTPCARCTFRTAIYYMLGTKLGMKECNTSRVTLQPKSISLYPFSATAVALFLDPSIHPLKPP